jgi:hypothetical protein
VTPAEIEMMGGFTGEKISSAWVLGSQPIKMSLILMHSRAKKSYF